MAISTHKIFLMRATGGSYSKLIDIKDFPPLGGAPEMLQTTTLSDGAHTYIPGIQGQEALEFTSNYTVEDFDNLRSLEGQELKLAVWFGGDVVGGVATPTGSMGKFSFSGSLSVFVDGGGVNEVVNMKITIAPSTVISFDAE